MSLPRQTQQDLLSRLRAEGIKVLLPTWNGATATVASEPDSVERALYIVRYRHFNAAVKEKARPFTRAG